MYVFKNLREIRVPYLFVACDLRALRFSARSSRSGAIELFRRTRLAGSTFLGKLIAMRKSANATLRDSCVVFGCVDVVDGMRDATQTELRAHLSRDDVR